VSAQDRARDGAISSLGDFTMADVVSVDMFLDGWYPGWKPEHLDNPWLRMKSVPF
jgi:hypothetical protein